MNKSKAADSVLLSTKLKMPQPRHDYIVRRSLFERLSRCSEMGVVFVEGAAGTGKTTLLSSFIRETGLKNTAWLSLDETNNNIFSFWYYFTAAVSGFLDDEEETFNLMDLNVEANHIRRSISFLINRLCMERQLYIVLDDFHYITDTALIDSLEFFLKSMPENLHLFLLSRENPPVYLGALAVSGRLLFISGEQMQLSHEESLHFLRDTMKLSSDEEELGRISDFAEGWIGGLQLAAAGGVSGDMLKKGGGFVADYLTREIFERLTAEEQNFLICTGCLSYFDADICAHLFDKLDFSAMISTLSDKNLFITCIDEEKGIYRYHNILSEYLKQRFCELPKQKQDEICGKAVAEFEERGDYEEAARLLLAAKDYKNAMRVILKMDSNGNEENYINQLPVNLLISNPDLTFRSIIYNASSGNFIKFNELYDGIEKSWKESPFYDLVLYAKNMLVRDKNLVSFPKIMTISEIQNLHLNPATASMVLIGFANLLIMDRNYALGEQFADLAQKTCMKNFSASFYTLSFKAQLDEETGRLNESLSVYRQMEEIINPRKSAFFIRFLYGMIIISALPEFILNEWNCQMLRKLLIRLLKW